MSTPIIIGIVVLCFIGIIILRRQFRSSVAKSAPHVTFVDEALLDLVRTRQIRAATTYYQEHSGATAKDAEKAVEYLVRRPEVLMLMVRVMDGETPSLYMDDTLAGYLKQGRTMKAINYYCDKAGTDPREAQIAVGALFANPEMRFKRD